MGKFIITRRADNEFQFKLTAGNGQTILTSEGYKVKFNCQKGIESVQENAMEDKRFDKKVSSNGKPYFNLKASNGEIIGTSQMYESAASRDAGILSVKNNAPHALIEDNSN